MSRSRFENLEPERQQKLFESATNEFADHGYEGASLNRILETSGMSKSSLYYYFDDKADLFTTMFERAVSYLLREVGGFDIESLTGENYWQEMEALYRRSVSYISRDDWYLKLGRAFYRMRGGKKKVAPVEQSFNLVQHWVDRFIRRGQDLGVVRTDLPQSMLIASVMGLGEALDHWAVDHWEEYTKEEMLDLVGVQMKMIVSVFGKEAECAKG